MSVKVASVTSATAAPRELRKAMATKTRKHEDETLVLFRVSVPSWLHLDPFFQEQASERRDDQAQRVIEAVRGDRLGVGAAAVADVAAAVRGGVAVQELRIEAG